jgi:hypothetical protein
MDYGLQSAEFAALSGTGRGKPRGESKSFDVFVNVS